VNKELADKLFEALAILDLPLSNACERAIDYVRDNEHLSEKDKNEIRDASKSLIRGYQLLHHYLSLRHPEFDFVGDGEELFKSIKSKNSTFKGD